MTARFAAEARSVAPGKPSLTLRRLVLEAITLGRFANRYWEPSREGDALVPGLRSAASVRGLSRDVARDLSELATLVQSLDSELRATKTRPAPAPIAESRALLAEMRAALRFLLAGRPSMQPVFDKVAETARGRSAFALAAALEAHAALTDKHVRELANLDGFDADLPERALRLALRLRERRRDHRADGARSAKLAERDALVSLLIDRMRAVRETARFVFRDHPQIARKATSDYERKRRRKSRARVRRASVAGSMK